MLPTTSARQQPDTFRLLDLPGEIRNVIYGYCSDEPHTLAWKGPRNLRRTADLNCLSLTQINREVRAEYLGFLANNFTHRVRPQDLIRYTDTFLVPYSLAQGTLEIDIGRTKWERKPTDFAPFLRLWQGLPGLIVTIVSTRPKGLPNDVAHRCPSPDAVARHQQVIRGLRSDPTSKWTVYLANSVEHIWIKPSMQWKPRAEIVIKKPQSQQSVGSIRAWMAESGCPLPGNVGRLEVSVAN